MKEKILAFYLPQFHPIEENNEWWGAGFTEWTNTSVARPRFKGHHQPHVPADLGFYDLRLEDTRIAQAELAAQYGINGFCYYHYWFNGKRLLERPFNKVLESGRPDFPFCLCWANENWTRAWDGLERKMLIHQEYSEADTNDHINWLLTAFKDSRYIKVDGRPLFLIYRVDNIPNIGRMIDQWRVASRDNGFEDIYLVAVKNGFVSHSDREILNLGFDALVDFQPNRNDFPSETTMRSALYQIARRFLPDSIYQQLKLSISVNNIVNYKKLIDHIVSKSWPEEYRKFPCVFPSWDNSARRESATIIQNNEPSIFGQWVSKAIANVGSYPEEERFVFVNAWNEWAEGCHLEPDRKHGRAFLEALKEAIDFATVEDK